MRNLYHALGLSGIVRDPQLIERALTQSRGNRDLKDRVRWILLDPGRKAHYDWILERSMELVVVRKRLKLPVDGLLPAPSPGPLHLPSGHPSQHPRGNGILAMVSLGLVALAILSAQAWTTPRPQTGSMEAPVAAPSPASRPVGPASVPAAPAPRGEELPTAAPPGHGWLQMEPTVLPRVPWRIETDPGRDYLVTLLDAKTQTVLMTLFLQGGAPYYGLAPEGEFQLAYTSGTRWLGPQHGFAGDPPPIRSDQRFQIAAGPMDEWAWHLRLHAHHFEASSISPQSLKRPDSGY